MRDDSVTFGADSCALLVERGFLLASLRSSLSRSASSFICAMRSLSAEISSAVRRYLGFWSATPAGRPRFFGCSVGSVGSSCRLSSSEESIYRGSIINSLLTDQFYIMGLVQPSLKMLMGKLQLCPSRSTGSPSNPQRDMVNVLMVVFPGI